MCAHNQGSTSSTSAIFPRNTTVIVYSSGTMRYALTTFANLAVLLVGITIGVILAPHVEKHAQAAEGQTQTPAAPAVNNSSPEQVQPQMTIGTIGAYIVLSHHVQSDEMVVNGIDILKLEQGELNLLSRIPGVYPWEVQGIVDNAKATHLYQVASPKPPVAAPSPK